MYELISRTAIQKVLAIYANAVDVGEMDEVLSVFTPAAVFQPLPGHPTCFGHSQIRSCLSRIQSQIALLTADRPAPFMLSHHLTTSKIDFDTPMKARGFTRFLAMSNEGMDHSGYYTDTFETSDNMDWFLTYRRITLNWVAPQSPIPALLQALDLPQI